jgi:Fic family protein
MRSRYLDLEDRTQDLAEQLREEPAIAQEFLKRYEFSWIHHENAMEGVVFSGQELETALAHPAVTDLATINAFRDVRNLKAAIDLVRAEAASKKPRITLALLKRLYETLHAGIESRAAAEFRKEIPLHRAYFHDIAQPARIAAQLEALLASTETAEFRSGHPVQQASRLQHGFMQIYPYTEGSGKIARLLSNLILLNAEYQPCIIHSIDRQRYYDSLRHPEPQLRDLIVESIANGLTTAEKFLRHSRAARLRRVAQ